LDSDRAAPQRIVPARVQKTPAPDRSDDADAAGSPQKKRSSVGRGGKEFDDGSVPRKATGAQKGGKNSRDRSDSDDAQSAQRKGSHSKTKWQSSRDGTEDSRPSAKKPDPSARTKDTGDPYRSDDGSHSDNDCPKQRRALPTESQMESGGPRPSKLSGREKPHDAEPPRRGLAFDSDSSEERTAAKHPPAKAAVLSSTEESGARSSGAVPPADDKRRGSRRSTPAGDAEQPKKGKLPDPETPSAGRLPEESLGGSTAARPAKKSTVQPSEKTKSGSFSSHTDSKQRPDPKRTSGKAPAADSLRLRPPLRQVPPPPPPDIDSTEEEEENSGGPVEKRLAPPPPDVHRMATGRADSTRG
jgi:hypothetical protein